MKPQVVLHMALAPGQTDRLLALQQVFAQACNHLSPIVQQTRCWNRVALHHMAYRELRERFPALGSQMACNVIYSVSRTCRALFQSRSSPYALHKLGGGPLPRLLFLPQSPVYFDRHTLSLKDGRISMYTLDGRIRFDARLQVEQDEMFRQLRLREVVMSGSASDLSLTFYFDPTQSAPGQHIDDTDALTGELPEYVMVVDTPSPGLADPGPLPTTRTAISP